MGSSLVALLLAERSTPEGRNDTRIVAVLPECAREKGRVWRLLVSLARPTRTPDQSDFQDGGARRSAQWETNQPPSREE